MVANILGDLTVDADKELIACGLMPGSWKDSLAAIKSGLSPADWDRFSRLHRSFVSYNSPDTLSRFYTFVFSHGLQLDINRPRFGRLAGILTVLAEEIPTGISILDLGAGSGLIATIVKQHQSPLNYTVQDTCAEVRIFLEKKGFSVLAHPAPIAPDKLFDLILCIDSLGEINADEDGRLSENSEADASEFALLMEERYGILEKLDPWKAYLNPQGRVLIWEPFKHNRVWEALISLLERASWKVALRFDASGRPFLELRQT